MRYVVLDLETTGLSPYVNRITEIGAARVEDGEVRREFQTLVNPGTPIPRFITKLTGIDDAMVKDAPSIEEALPGFLRFLRDDLMVAHNASFDHSFLAHSARTTNLSFANERLCTRRLANRLVPELPSKRLAALCEHFKVSNEQAHRAMGDVHATHEIFLRLQALMRAQGIEEKQYCAFSSASARGRLSGRALRARP